jgi:plasmid stabilization system protein ParE
MYIAVQDPGASSLVYQRLLVALDVISLQPAIGTPTHQKNIRRFPIPKTGHTIEYRVTTSEIVITRWIRQARVKKI